MSIPTHLHPLLFTLTPDSLTSLTPLELALSIFHPDSDTFETPSSLSLEITRLFYLRREATRLSLSLSLSSSSHSYAKEEIRFLLTPFTFSISSSTSTIDLQQLSSEELVLIQFHPALLGLGKMEEEAVLARAENVWRKRRERDLRKGLKWDENCLIGEGKKVEVEVVGMDVDAEPAQELVKEKNSGTDFPTDGITSAGGNVSTNGSSTITSTSTNPSIQPTSTSSSVSISAPPFLATASPPPVSERQSSLAYSPAPANSISSSPPPSSITSSSTSTISHPLPSKPQTLPPLPPLHLSLPPPVQRHLYSLRLTNLPNSVPSPLPLIFPPSLQPIASKLLPPLRGEVSFIAYAAWENQDDRIRAFQLANTVRLAEGRWGVVAEVLVDEDGWDWRWRDLKDEESRERVWRVFNRVESGELGEEEVEKRKKEMELKERVRERKREREASLNTGTGEDQKSITVPPNRRTQSSTPGPIASTSTLPSTLELHSSPSLPLSDPVPFSLLTKFHYLYLPSIPSSLFPFRQTLSFLPSCIALKRSHSHYPPSTEEVKNLVMVYDDLLAWEEDFEKFDKDERFLVVRGGEKEVNRGESWDWKEFVAGSKEMILEREEGDRGTPPRPTGRTIGERREERELLEPITTYQNQNRQRTLTPPRPFSFPLPSTTLSSTSRRGSTPPRPSGVFMGSQVMQSSRSGSAGTGGGGLMDRIGGVHTGGSGGSPGGSSVGTLVGSTNLGTRGSTTTSSTPSSSSTSFSNNSNSTYTSNSSKPRFQPPSHPNHQRIPSGPSSSSSSSYTSHHQHQPLPSKPNSHPNTNRGGVPPTGPKHSSTKSNGAYASTNQLSVQPLPSSQPQPHFHLQTGAGSGGNGRARQVSNGSAVSGKLGGSGKPPPTGPSSSSSSSSASTNVNNLKKRVGGLEDGPAGQGGGGGKKSKQNGNSSGQQGHGHGGQGGSGSGGGSLLNRLG